MDISQELKKLIGQYASESLATVALKLQKLPVSDRNLVLDQIHGLQKAKQKLPSYFKTQDVLYPPKLNLEQCSSEQTALFKAAQIQGKSLIDLTGGFGVDSWAFSQSFEKVLYVEQNSLLTEIAQHNFGKLKAENIVVHSENAQSFLENFGKKADWIYLDPARRDSQNRAVAQIVQTEPNVIQLMPLMLRIANNILLKTSPMFDIQQAITDLKLVKKVWVVSVENECKEVLYWLGRDKTDEILIEAVNLQPNKPIHIFIATKQAEEQAQIGYSEPLKYLYEPNASIMKAGFFKKTASFYSINKIHPHTHLYTSDRLMEDFQGRIFEVERVLKGKTAIKEIQQLIPEKKAHITTRNYPLKVEEIRKQTKLAEGGEQWIWGLTLYDESKALLLAKRILI